MNRRISSLCIPALAAVLASGSALASEPFTDLVNADEEEGFDAAVSIGAEFFGFRQSTCTASLITPRILLTAAHCTQEFVNQGLPLDQITELGRAFFHPDISSAPEDRVVAFEEVINHPDYIGITPVNQTPAADIGVIILAEDAPVEPVWFNTDDLDEDDAFIGSKVTSVGYGITSAATQSGSGIKRSARLTVSDLDDDFIISLGSENRDGANVCQGDSGGPQYRKLDDGRWQQVSIHSWATQECYAMSGSVRTDLYTDWILDRVEEVHGTADFCDASGYYDDGTCDTFCDEIDPDCVEQKGGAGGCHTAGSAPAALGALGLLGLLGLRRRRD